MVSRKPRQIVGDVVSRNRSARTIQRMVDKAEEAAIYCTDGYSGYLDVVFPGKHLFNIHSKKDTFTVEGVNADLRHYIPTLARKSRCFPRKLENLQARLLQIMCKPPEWCKIEASHRRLYTGPKRIEHRKKRPAGRKSVNCYR